MVPTTSATQIQKYANTPIKVGPILHYRGEEIETATTRLSLMVLINDHGPSTPLPKVKLYGKTVKKLAGEAIATSRGSIFARYLFDIPKTSEAQKIVYSVNGRYYPLYIPAKGEAARMALYSCNGYQTDKDRERMGGIQPMWKELMREHAKKPFSSIYGMGDILYCDGLVGKAEEPRAKNIRGVFALPTLQEWLTIEDKNERNAHPFTLEMAEEVTEFYLEHYTRQYKEKWFRKALATIPHAMSWDDHDTFDGFGSYPDELQQSPVFQGIFEVSLMYYLLFQHQIPPNEMSKCHLFGKNSYNFLFTVDEGKTAILGLDNRAERTADQVVSPETWDQIFKKLDELPEQCEHLFAMLSIPVAYPSLKLLDDTLKLADKNKAVGWALGQIPGMHNQFGEWELADDGRDHWSHSAHIKERNEMLSRFEALAKKKNIRVTLLGGDVHLGAMAKIYDKRTHKVNKAAPETMWGFTTSPIGNAPAPSAIVKVLKTIAKTSKGIYKDHKMKLVKMAHESQPNKTDSMFPSRNFGTAQRNLETGVMKMALHVEPNRKKKRTECHVHSIDIPPNKPGVWLEPSKNLFSKLKKKMHIPHLRKPKIGLNNSNS